MSGRSWICRASTSPLTEPDETFTSGAPAVTELTKREAEICKRIGPSLRERGLLFVGIDVIDGWLTEINVTSPTGIRAIKALGGADIATMIWDKIEAKRKA